MASPTTSASSGRTASSAASAQGSPATGRSLARERFIRFSSGPISLLNRDEESSTRWSSWPGYRPGDGFVWLGVNLDGMQYDDWPVERLIERGISPPLLLTRYLRKGPKTR